MKAITFTSVIALIIVAFPLISLLIAMAALNVALPFSDDLLMIEPLYRLHVSQEFTFSDLVYQINEHVAIIPFLLVNIVVLGGEWSTTTLLLINPILAAGNLYLWYRLARRTLPNLPSGEQLFLSFATGIFATSFLQWEIWSHVSTINLTLPITAALLAAFLLSTNRPVRHRLLGASIACLIASFSSTIGLFTWLAVMPQVFFISSHHKTARTILWFGLFIITVSLVTLAHNPEAQLTHRSAQFQSVGFYLAFAALTAGAAVLPSHFFITGTLGALILLSLVLILGQQLRSRELFRPHFLPWLSLTLFFITVIAILAWGRGSWGIYGRALQSRYVALSYPLVVTLIYVLYQQLWPKPSARPLLRLAMIMLITLNLASGILALPSWQNRYINISLGRTCLHQAATAPVDCLSRLGNSALDGEFVRQQAPLMKQLSAF